MINTTIYNNNYRQSSYKQWPSGSTGMNSKRIFNKFLSPTHHVSLNRHALSYHMMFYPTVCYILLLHVLLYIIRYIVLEYIVLYHIILYILYRIYYMPRRGCSFCSLLWMSKLAALEPSPSHCAALVPSSLGFSCMKAFVWCSAWKDFLTR